MKTPEQIAEDVLDQVCISKVEEVAHIGQIYDVIERAIEADRAQRGYLQDGDYILGGVYHRVEGDQIYAVPTTSIGLTQWRAFEQEYGKAERVR